MSIIAAAVLLVAAEGPVMIVSAPEGYDIGFDELVRGDDHAALEAIENCKDLPENDPARQINHAVALARVGEFDAARESFTDAARNAERFELETASGEWVDSRVLARRGLAMLEEGSLSDYRALAVR